MPMPKKSAPSKKAAAPAKKAVQAAKTAASAKSVRYVVLDTPLRSKRYPTIGQGFAKAA